MRAPPTVPGADPLFKTLCSKCLLGSFTPVGLAQLLELSAPFPGNRQESHWIGWQFWNSLHLGFKPPTRIFFSKPAGRCLSFTDLPGAQAPSQTWEQIFGCVSILIACRAKEPGFIHSGFPPLYM